MLVSRAEELFAKRSGSASKNEEEELTAPLFEEIGRLKMDLRWLEKNFEPAGLRAANLGCAGFGLLDSSVASLGRRFEKQLSYEPVSESKENLELIQLMDEQYLRHPEFW